MPVGVGPVALEEEEDREVEVAAAAVNSFAISAEHSAGGVAGRIFFRQL
jgi:hypothetical protein